MIKLILQKLKSGEIDENKAYEKIMYQLENDEEKTMGPKHRFVRHHQGGLVEAEKELDPMGRRATEIHIKADCAGRVPTEQETKLW